ncbi:MAG: alkaline phosphatase D family protein [Saprospiraceae bacterium]
MRHLFGCLFLLLSCAHLAAQQSLLQSGPMLGYTDLLETVVWVQTTEPAEVFVSYTELGDARAETSRTSVVRTERHLGNTAKLTADRVQPGRTYRYAVHINGKELSFSYPTIFRTQQLWRWRNDPPEFTVAVGSCSYINEPEYDRPGPGYGSEYEIFTALDRANPEVMFWLGDNTYLREVDWYTRTGYLHRYTHTRSLPEMQPLLARTHNLATWDDHDYGPNNSDRTWIHKELAKEMFDLFWANPTSGLPGLGGITTFYQYHDIDFLLLDNRSYRTPNDQKRKDNKTVLGKEQLEWLIESLIFSQAPYKMVGIGGQVLNTARAGETYTALAPAERAYLLRRIEEEDISGVVFLTGDRHHSELSTLKMGNGKLVHDLTVSSLTAGTGTNRSEVNDLRVDGTLAVLHNFGLLTFSGPRTERLLTVQLRDKDGKEIWKRELRRE